MTIKNFSKDILLISSEYADFSDLDTLTQKTALSNISKVISRLNKIGFEDYKLVGDDSLSIELEDFIVQSGHTPTIYNMYPNTVKEFLKESIINKSRSRYLNRKDLSNIASSDTAKSLIEIEMKLGSMLSTEVILKEEITDDKKIDTILRVMALTYYGITVNQKTLFKYESEFLSFFVAIERTREEVEGLIKSDLDYRWEWAKGYLYSDTYVNQKVDSDEDEYTEEDARMAEIMALLNDKPIEKSNLLFEIDEEKIHQSNEEYEEQNQTSIDESIEQLSLTEGLKTLDRKEFSKSSVLIDELNNVLKVIDDYTGVIYTKVVKESNLIVDLYVSRTSLRSRKLPYKNITDNKILISVDIKTGDVEAFFKGRPFKLNPLFDKDETVKTNVSEW